MHKKLDFIKCSSFASFIPIKEVGVCTLWARFAGGKATTNKNLIY